ncbi:unnamed protein product [Schistocephalus solidus]|uniref:Uncharacterized protein n=1 Tax=Schistocephalus solidus TaxID=70667 RepID=A0A183T7A0_SCHSO|nr:unnamed protein product [Schistocephalus solidus]
MCCCKCLFIGGTWRLVVWLDEFLTVFVQPFHPILFEAVVRMFLPACPKPRPVYEFYSYFCFICPLEWYRKCSGRDPKAVGKLLKEAVCFLCKTVDIFDIDEIAEETGNLPDWKYYMLKGRWPWEEEDDDEADDDDEYEN